MGQCLPVNVNADARLLLCPWMLSCPFGHRRVEGRTMKVLPNMEKSIGRTLEILREERRRKAPFRGLIMAACVSLEADFL
jgi:hypothetical protein